MSEKRWTEKCAGCDEEKESDQLVMWVYGAKFCPRCTRELDDDKVLAIAHTYQGKKKPSERRRNSMYDPAVKSTVQACQIRALEKKLFNDPNAQTALDLEKALGVRNAHYYAPVLEVLAKARKALWYRPALRAEIDEALTPFKDKPKDQKEGVT